MEESEMEIDSSFFSPIYRKTTGKRRRKKRHRLHQFPPVSAFEFFSVFLSGNSWAVLHILSYHRPRKGPFLPAKEMRKMTYSTFFLSVCFMRERKSRLSLSVSQLCINGSRLLH